MVLAVTSGAQRASLAFLPAGLLYDQITVGGVLRGRSARAFWDRDREAAYAEFPRAIATTLLCSAAGLRSELHRTFCNSYFVLLARELATQLKGSE